MSNAKLEKKLCLAKDTPEPVFDVSECDIKRIPNGIFSVIKVLRKEFLYLQNNKLSSLKEGGNLHDLCLLKLLDLRSNKISKLPSEIKNLKNLQILRLDHNELTSLPIEIGSLLNLEQFTISSNCLKSLPDSIGNLKNLQHMDLRFNINLRSLPATIYKNKRLQSILLDDNQEWIEPPTSVVRNSTQAIIAYFAQKRNLAEIEEDETDCPEEFSPSKSLQQLSIYDKFIQDNLRRLEKEKEDKLCQKIEMEKSIFEQQKKELLICQQSLKEKQKLMNDLTEEQRKIDEKVLKCHKRREEDQNNFIRQLQSVENSADEVIKRLLETNNVQKQQHVSSIISSLIEDIPVKENLRERKVLETMEKLLAEEYLLSLKLQENDDTRQNLIRVSNLNDKRLENKIFNLLTNRRKEQCSLIDCIQKDISLQYAAVLMFIEKSDSRNIELQNQISVIQSQLSNLTAIELQNKNLHLNKHINELVERRVILTNLLQDIFTQQQSHRKLLIDQLREVENFQSSVFQNKNEYWLIQFQRLLDSNRDNLSAASLCVDPAIIYELALFGVSHYAPLLSTFDLKSAEGLSTITNDTLEMVGVRVVEDRRAILNAIQHFISDRCSYNTLPSAPALQSDINDSFGSSATNANDSNSDPSTDRSAPVINNISDTKSINSLNEVLLNECVICLERQSNIVFLPCGHLCNCGTCSLSVNQCPLCRCDIKSKMQIFTA